MPVKFTGTVDCPDRDIALSDLGEKQAKLLGKELALRNFKGIIVSSPYLRTMTTAEAVASACDVKIYPEALFREGVFNTQKIMLYILVRCKRAHICIAVYTAHDVVG